MSLVRYGAARRIAIERIVSVMRANFGAQISAATARLDLSPLPTVDTPTDRAYFMVDPEQLTVLPKVFRAWVFVFPDGPRVPVSTSTGSGNILKMQTTIDINVLVAFRYIPDQSPLDSDNVVIEQDELMRYRAEVYVDAMTETIARYAKSPSTIHALEPANDTTYPIYLDKFPTIGVARTTWRLTQMCVLPDAECC